MALMAATRLAGITRRGRSDIVPAAELPARMNG